MGGYDVPAISTGRRFIETPWEFYRGPLIDLSRCLLPTADLPRLKERPYARKEESRRWLDHKLERFFAPDRDLQPCQAQTRTHHHLCTGPSSIPARSLSVIPAASYIRSNPLFERFRALAFPKYGKSCYVRDATLTKKNPTFSDCFKLNAYAHNNNDEINLNQNLNWIKLFNTDRTQRYKHVIVIRINCKRAIWILLVVPVLSNISNSEHRIRQISQHLQLFRCLYVSSSGHIETFRITLLWLHGSFFTQIPDPARILVSNLKVLESFYRRNFRFRPNPRVYISHVFNFWRPTFLLPLDSSRSSSSTTAASTFDTWRIPDPLASTE